MQNLLRPTRPICARLPLRPPDLPTANSISRASRKAIQTKQARWYASQRPPRQSWVIRWARRPNFFYEIGGFGIFAGAVYVYNSERVPVSGRRRFNVVGPDWEREMGLSAYGSLMEQEKGNILQAHDSRVIRVKRVLSRLVAGLEDLKQQEEELTDKHKGMVVQGQEGGGLDDWEVNVIQSKEINAFVLPGNKVFVFSGILPICGNDDGIATVLSHEIAHNICHHAAEQTSNSFLYYISLVGLFITTGYIDIWSIGALDLVLNRPRSRGMESEADQVGLKLMATSCYDPRTAPQFWTRMDQAQQLKPPEFLSTHPSDKTRIRQINGWMEGAYEAYMKQGCPNQLSRNFRDVVGPWAFRT